MPSSPLQSVMVEAQSAGSPCRLLLVEDELVQQSFLHGVFATAGYDVVIANTVAEARIALAEHDLALAVVDVRLPDGSGYDLVPFIRRYRVSMGVVILTSRDGEADRLAGLELGVDDYITKPFNPRELLLRVRNLLQRLPAGGGKGREEQVRPTAYRFAGRRFDPVNRTLETPNGDLTVLTLSEARLLEALIRQAGAALARRELLDAIGRTEASSARAVDWLVLRLRRKLVDDARNPQLIRGIRGVGYRFNAQADWVS